MNQIKNNIIISVIILTLSTIAVAIFNLLNIDYYIIIIVLVLAIMSAILLFGKRGYVFGYLMWIMLFTLGYRTVEITENFRLHPLVVISLFLFAVLFIRIGVFAHQAIQIRIPVAVWGFSIFWLLGLHIGAINNLPLDRMLAHVSNFVILIPIFTITAYILEDENNWHSVILMFYLVGGVIATLGTIEFIFPEIRETFRDFIAHDPTSIRGFVRASFSFFGNQNATFLCALALPFVLPLIGWYQRLMTRFLLILLSIIMLYGIYIGGHRSVWVMMLIAFFIITLLYKKFSFALVFLATIVLILAIVPPEGIDRLLSLEQFAEGSRLDNSLYVRSQRVTTLFDDETSILLGKGWSATGWVHNDFVQLWADTGFFSFLFFVGWYLTTLVIIILQAFRKSSSLDVSLAASFLIAGMLFLTQPIYVLPQLVVPVWTVWAIVATRIRAIRSNKEADVQNEAYSSYPNLQQREALIHLHRKRKVGG